jgi:hypothetical protein
MGLTRQPASITLAALLITAAVSAVERSAKWWSDNLAGPDQEIERWQSRGRLDVPLCGRRIQPDCR